MSWREDSDNIYEQHFWFCQFWDLALLSFFVLFLPFEIPFHSNLCVYLQILFTDFNLSAKVAKSEFIQDLILSASIENDQWFFHSCNDCFRRNVFLGDKDILSFLRTGFYSSFLMAIGRLILNGLEIELQPVKAYKKRSCLASLKGPANLFMLHRRVTFPTLSEVKNKIIPFLVNEKAK